MGISSLHAKATYDTFIHEADNIRNVKTRFTQKKKNILLGSLDSNWAGQALFNLDDIAGGMQTPEEFKETYGYSEEEAMEALAALVNHLKK